MSIQTIKVITLDLDNTLWLTWPVIARANEALHRYLSEKYPIIAHKYPPETWRPLQDKIMENHPEFKTDFTKIRMKAIEHCAACCNVENPKKVASEVFNVFINERCNTKDFLFPNVIKTLQALKSRGYIIGSLSNGNADITKMDHLNEFFTFNIGSAGKPDLEAFSKAFELSKKHCIDIKNIEIHSPNEIMHVGDSIYSDVIPGKKFGFQTIWVKTGDDNDASEEEIPKEADYILDAFEEITNILK